MKTLTRKILLGITVAAAAAALSAGISACTASGNFPDYILPSNQTPGQEDEMPTNKYIINTLSVGGIKLKGVTVEASLGGNVLRRAISNENGQVFLSLQEGVYDLSYSDLPAGYYVDTENTVTQTPATFSKLNACFPSKIISATASSSTSYQLGDVMHNYEFTDYKGNAYNFADVLNPESPNYKKAIFLNFWYTTCTPCRSEIPAMEAAYKVYSNDVLMLGLTHQDSNSSIGDFVESMATRKNNPVNITYPLGYDTTLRNYFGVTDSPTTVVIDRYGAVVAMHVGAVTAEETWVNLFKKYSSASYEQVVEGGASSGGDVGEFVPDIPDVPDPDYANEEYKEILWGDNFHYDFYVEPKKEDKLYSWPWVMDESGNALIASNIGKRYSYANLYSDVTLKNNEVLSFEYNISANYGVDYLYVLVDREIALELTGNSKGWKTANILLSNKDQTVEVAFCYKKGDVDPDAEAEYSDTARIRNLYIYDAEHTDIPTDIIRDAAKTPNQDKTRYTEYVEVALSPKESGGDGYYHVVEDGGTLGSILYADILKIANWQKLHLAKRTISAENQNWTASLWYLAYWKLSNYENVSDDGVSVPLLLFAGHKKESDELIAQYYMQGFSDNGLTPVNEAMKEVLELFIAQYAEKDANVTVYENEWLEFCYYFEHYGDDHAIYAEVHQLETADWGCSVKDDPVKGMSHFNAFTAEMGVNHVRVHRPKNTDPAVRFKFVVPSSGTYLFYSTLANDKDVETDPEMAIVTEDGTYLYSEDDCLFYDTFAVCTSISGAATDPTYGKNFRFKYYLTGGETVYLYMRMHMPGALGEYDLHIEKLSGTEAQRQLRQCTTGDGVFVGDITGEFEDFEISYVSIDVVYDDITDKWYADNNGELGSPIYVSMIRSNFMDQNGHSVYDFIQNGVFDLRKTGGDDYTEDMMRYYNQSLENTGELYGFVEADGMLQWLMDVVCSRAYEAELGQKAWLSCACYYEYYGN